MTLQKETVELAFHGFSLPSRKFESIDVDLKNLALLHECYFLDRVQLARNLSLDEIQATGEV